MVSNPLNIPGNPLDSFILSALELPPTPLFFPERGPMRRVEVHPMHSSFLDGRNGLPLPRSPIKGTWHNPPSPSPRYPTQASEGGVGDRHLEYAPNTNRPAIRFPRLLPFPFSSRPKVGRGNLPERATRSNLYCLSGLLC